MCACHSPSKSGTCLNQSCKIGPKQSFSISVNVDKKHLNHDLRVIVVHRFELFHHLVTPHTRDSEHAQVVGQTALLHHRPQTDEKERAQQEVRNTSPKKILCFSANLLQQFDKSRHYHPLSYIIQAGVVTRQPYLMFQASGGQ